MRYFVAVVTVALLSAAVFLSGPRGPRRSQTASTVPDRRFWVKLTFGLDHKPVAWDGGVEIAGGRIVGIEPWSFEKRDRLDPVSRKWFCTTVVLEGRSASSFAEPQRGVLIEVERDQNAGADGSPSLAVTTKQGEFQVDVSKLEPGRASLFLDDRASAEILGPSQALPDRVVDSDAATEDDFPTLTVDGSGRRWLAWIAYDEVATRDRLRVVCLDDPSSAVKEIATAREQVDPVLTTDADGAPLLFWCAPEGGNWDVWSARRTDDGWDGPARITHAEGSDFHLDVARGVDGEIWLAWQAFRNGNSDVRVRKRFKDGRWSREFPVASSPANDWEPSVSVASDGRAWIAFDSYRNGNYDVFLTDARIDSPAGDLRRGDVRIVAGSADFEAHGDVEATGDGLVWVAWDAAGPNWGKDYLRDTTSYKGRYGETLHASRRIGMRAFRPDGSGGEWVEPQSPLPQEITKLHPEKILHSDTDEIKRFYELPQLVRDGDGRLWTLFRLNRQGYAGHPRMGANWEFYATTYADGRWLEPMLLPVSKGRQNQHVSAAVAKGGRLDIAWSTGDHHVDLPQTVRVGRLPKISAKPVDPPTRASERAVAEKSPEEPLVRSWKMQRKGEEYQVYFGDLHRHTDISLCFPTADGCLVDAYRYALDAARMDFLAVTDHTRDTDPLPWWRTQKTNDLFLVKDVFAPIYGYERSNGVAGGGHRNVFFLERDQPVFRGDAHYSGSGDERPDNNNPDVALYPHLRGRKALTAAHTPGYSKKAGRGTWTYNDPQVEPIAEIIQTFRRDYERPGKPQWPDARDRSSIAEESSLWYALAKGHKLGFIASSDHHATHTSYACVWAKGPSREEIFEGLQNRRTYAATDKIMLEVRMNEAAMGEEIAGPARPELRIRARGTAPIEEVQIVRNRKVIGRLKPDAVEFETTFRDPEPPGGAAYYYVRLRQNDNGMAWGSPIWVR